MVRDSQQQVVSDQKDFLSISSVISETFSLKMKCEERGKNCWGYILLSVLIKLSISLETQHVIMLGMWPSENITPAHVPWN